MGDHRIYFGYCPFATDMHSDVRKSDNFACKKKLRLQDAVGKLGASRERHVADPTNQKTCEVSVPLDTIPIVLSR